jgi:hypothetical protein
MFTNNLNTDKELFIQSQTNNSNSNSNIKGILKNTNDNTDDINIKFNILQYIKTVIFIIIFMLIMPFIVGDLYYAYTDNSCVNLEIKNFDITLKNYLEVDGIFCAIGLFIALFIAFNNNNNNNLLNIIIKTATLFGIAWTIVGAIIFWKLIDNSKCNNGIYTYVFIQLIIKFMFYFLRIVFDSK